MPSLSTAEIEGRVAQLLDAEGPKIGKELTWALPDVPVLNLWQACFRSQSFLISHFASYCLRFDITRGDQVRLSSSILRDVLSFTLFGLPGQREQMIERQGQLSNMHPDVNRKKLGVVQAALCSLFIEQCR